MTAPPTEADIERQLLEDVLNRITRLNAESLGTVAREATKLGYSKLRAQSDALSEMAAQFLGINGRVSR